MARRTNNRTTQRHQVTYPGYETVTLHIIIDNLDAAERGEENYQSSIAWQYFKVLGYKNPPSWEWSRFSFTPSGQVEPPTAGTMKPAKQAETYGCTCERDCAGCDQGWHNTCRYGCKNGQPVK